ncbi:hypothetical protein FRC01_006810 [Tulasnella sp. 417]|nr:hypothetical protein FRC01_006810 [Tulasnella sp. 417]
MFVFDETRGWLLHARINKSQAYPPNAQGPDYRRLPFVPPLDPSRCSGKWFLVSDSVAADVRAIEADMLSLWESIEAGRKLSIQEEASALYLRQLFDYFLHNLAKTAEKDPAAASFDNPLKLTSVEEPHMQNAIKNKTQGKPYSDGAWILPGNAPDAKPRTKRRKQRPDRQPAEVASGSRKSGSEGHVSDDHSEHHPRRSKRIKLEEDSEDSSWESQQALPSDVAQEMEVDDPTVAAAHSHPTIPAEYPHDDDTAHTESTLSSAPSPIDEGPIQEATTEGQADSTTQVSERPSRSKKVQFVTMFDEAVPILQAILDGMPISPEDLEGHPNFDEKLAALLQWGHRKGQAVRLLGAMQKAYLSVMTEHDPRAVQGARSTPNESERERTLATDPPPPQEPHANDMPYTTPPVDKNPRGDDGSAQAMAQNKRTKRNSTSHRASEETSTKITQLGPAKGKAAANSAVVSSYLLSRDDGFWAAFGY